MKNYSAMAVLPRLIIVKDKASKSLIEHERMHQAQMIYCGGVLRFWSLYFLFYLIGLVKYMPILFTDGVGVWHRKAYRMSRLEIEARNT